jgi:hypothetical protein
MLKCLGCCLLAANLAAGASVFTETFDTDAAGFGPNTTASVVVWAGSGGNPDGHIQTRRDLDEDFFDIGALTSGAQFTGDYGADNISTMTADIHFQTDNFTGAWFRVRVDSLTNGWLFALTSDFTANVWNTYSFAFNPLWSDLEARAAGWITDQDLNPLAIASPTFASVMASVGTAEIRLGSTDESTLAFIDNVGLGQVPEPSSVVLVALGLAGIVYRRRSLRG